MNRVLWPLGIMLLVVSLVGAGWALNQATPQPPADTKDPHAPLPVVFCLGVVDVPDGVVELYPKQPGEVAEIADARANDKSGVQGERVFKKGDVLLRLQSQVAQNQLAKAKTALAAAETQLAEAKLLGPERDAKISIQEAAIQAAKHEKGRLDADLEGKRKSYQDNIGPVPKAILRSMEEATLEADAKIRVEQGKLKLLKLQDPDLKVRQATDDVNAKKLDVKIAEDYLKDFQIEAPTDGIILRVHTRVGELLGPNPRAAAIEFCPNVPRIVRAEVVQEWGDRVHVGQDALIQDDTYQGPEWQGRVKSISPWYAQKRVRIIEPFMMNDVRTLECIVEFTGGQTPVRIGQRMRVKIKV